ncbi:hypothetical protein LWI29_020902 [Acer saccharum]|uniref:protein-serine/threonine phosphatase n=1 Tax=Acer saccharum TaxID=4024 RepID=A0AA39SPA7_ACESA|nr:hypothetical protein LWI29_020902 [Acer saccharum]
MKKCVGRSNLGVTFGEATEQGLRKTMEDTCGIYPEFMTLSCIEVGGCTAPSCRYASVKSPVHYFGVFDGHGGSQASSHCANVLHIKLAEEWEKEVGIDDWCRRWEVALCRVFETVDDGLIDRALASVGSTASAVILSACQIIAANCGDSSVVLCRGKQAIPLTVDHKATDTPSVPEEQILHPSPLARETDNSSSIPSLNLSLNSEFEPMEAVAPPQETVKEPEESASGPNEFTESAFGSNGYTQQMMHAFYPGAYMPVPYAYWPPNAASREEEEDKEAENCHHKILKPIPILPKEPVNVDELVGMSHLSIVETAERRYREPSPLSLKLLGEPSRQSAFHANAPVSNPDLSNGKTSPIQAI